MSYDEFRRRIDTIRNILVGAVPSPAGQIDQITYALMYKFMNDIDDQAAALPGGKRTYFTGSYEQYNWHRLMDSSLGAHERIELYRQAIQTMGKNPALPELFREIYQNAFLPFNSPTVLDLFLKDIDKFTHTENDEIGDVYEYLLSITGAQGDVGQFRTPRHIIKFIVNAINPTKNDSVLDPACGTAGFLIAAYNHVKEQHDGKDANGQINDEKRLTADELSKLHHNYHGFDIDPTMVRTARVNMYLHGFTTPDIKNHDTLSSEDFWDKHYDVILANPPFMTPKGGIQPHKKFSITANRAEVLFVDYIASHINPITGRAGIIVPEGIIFQSGNAYKQLRKNLVEKYLYAVVSLPAGVFQPYSGVKTSVLLFDKKLTEEHDEVLFIKIENDGYTLGAQRRETTGEQFTEALATIESYKNSRPLSSAIAHAVPRLDIASSGDYNLNGDRYRTIETSAVHTHPITELSEVAEIRKGSSITKSQVNSYGMVPVIAGGQTPAYYHDTSNRDPEVTTISASGAYAGFVNYWKEPIFASDCSTVQTKDKAKALDRYLYVCLKYLQDDIYKLQTGGGQPHIYPKDIARIKIPLPPIEIQREIIAELDGYQKIIDAAQSIVKVYKPTMTINPEWPRVKIGDHIKIERGASPRPIDRYMTDDNNGENWVMISDTKNVTKYIQATAKRITKDGASKSRRVDVGDFILSNSMSFGRPYVMQTSGYIHDGWLALRTSGQHEVDKDFLYYILGTYYVQNQFEAAATGGVVRNLNSNLVRNTSIPLPPLEIQHEIVAELEAEQQLIDANKKLMEIYQQKIKSKLAEVWGE
jgi:type I restriction enzyme M protein